MTSIHSNAVLDAIDLGVSVSSPDISVYFAQDGEKLDFLVNEGDWTAYERASVMAALAAYAAVADVTFAITDTSDGATFKLTKSASEHGALGFMNAPFPETGEAQGIAWFNTFAYWGGAASGKLDPGSYTYTIFLHEFGHGLGLAHPHDESGMSGLMPQVGAGYGLDQGIFTVMTYNDGWPDHPEGGPDSRAWGWNLGPSAIDIAVLQAKYGANMDTETGVTIYRLPGADAPGTGYRAIWDAGGRDMLIHDGDVAAVLDLRAATLRAAPGGGGFVSFAAGVHGGFTIAHGVEIEDATGGAGGDRITGNPGANRLRGRGGDDHIAGRAGTDTLIGGRGADRLVAGPGRDTLDGGGGDDVLAGGGGRDVFVYALGGGRDRILDLDHGRDSLRLDHALWDDGLDLGGMMDAHARIRDGRTVLDFGPGHALVIAGTWDADTLVAMIEPM